MNRLKNVLGVYLTIGLMIFGFASGASAQTRTDRREVREILSQLNTKFDNFRSNLNDEFGRKLPKKK